MLLFLLRFSFSVKTFFIPEICEFVDVEDSYVKNYFNFSMKQLSKFVIDFSPEQRTILTSSCRENKDDGSYFYLKVKRNLLSYMITVHVPNIEKNPMKKYITSVQAIDGETERNSHWIEVSQDLIDMVMNGVKSKFGDDVELRNVVFFKIIRIGNIIGQLAIDAENDLERMLLDAHVVKPYGKDQYELEYVNRIC